MRPYLQQLIILLLCTIHTVHGKPTARMCASFAKFVSKWNPLPETLLSWTRNNCDKIQPRPEGMTCLDIVQFVSDCNYGSSSASSGGGSSSSAGEEVFSNRDLTERYKKQYYGNQPSVLPQYTYYSPETVRDFGQHGNWYYPNYYPPALMSTYDGHPQSVQQVENDLKFMKGGHYPYNRADNVVNIALQQTSLPTCLHDLFYCVRAQYANRYTNNYNKKYTYRGSRRYKHLHPEMDSSERR